MNQTISDQGVELIKQHEGLRLSVYTDAAGFPTIGYGHKISQGETIPGIITEQQAEQLLRDDLATAEQAVNRLVDVELTQSQFDALVSFTFNLGAGRLAESTLLKKLNTGDYDGAANELPRWVFAGGVKLAGLQNRRHDERELFLA